MNYLQQMPPDTSAYMIAGFAVIFGTMLLYVASLYIRRRNLEQDLTLLKDLEQAKQRKGPAMKNAAPGKKVVEERDAQVGHPPA